MVSSKLDRSPAHTHQMACNHEVKEEASKMDQRNGSWPEIPFSLPSSSLSAFRDQTQFLFLYFSFMAIKVKKDEQNPETPEILAKSIIQISKGFDEIMKAGFTKEGLVSMLKETPSCRTVGKQEIKSVLDGLKTLKGYYLR